MQYFFLLFITYHKKDSMCKSVKEFKVANRVLFYQGNLKLGYFNRKIFADAYTKISNLLKY